jgi:hypothetical protein
MGGFHHHKAQLSTLSHHQDTQTVGCHACSGQPAAALSIARRDEAQLTEHVHHVSVHYQVVVFLTQCLYILALFCNS